VRRNFSPKSIGFVLNQAFLGYVTCTKIAAMNCDFLQLSELALSKTVSVRPNAVACCCSFSINYLKVDAFLVVEWSRMRITSTKPAEFGGQNNLNILSRSTGDVVYSHYMCLKMLQVC
jgi:hypothetical protein